MAGDRHCRPPDRRGRRRDRRRRARVLGAWLRRHRPGVDRPRRRISPDGDPAGRPARSRRHRPRAALRGAGAGPRHPDRIPDPRLLRRPSRQRCRRGPAAGARASPRHVDCGSRPPTASIISTSSCRATARPCSSTSDGRTCARAPAHVAPPRALHPRRARPGAARRRGRAGRGAGRREGDTRPSACRRFASPPRCRATTSTASLPKLPSPATW